ncbi:MAG: PHB depolymerase family esterase, partial [Oxalobacteraceae bacterium]
MAGLGDTTAFLKQVRKYADAGMSGSAGPTRCREVSDFGENPGGLRMLAYAPVGLPAGAPLVVTLHGCTQYGEAYAAGAGWLDLADRLGFAVLAPEQVQGNNPSRCFNWFSSEDVRRGGGEVCSIANMIAAMVRDHHLDPDQVFITGLSAGGAMTAAMLAAYPELFAGGAIIAGLPYGSAATLPDALKVMQSGDGRSSAVLSELVRKAAPASKRPLRLSIWHGDADHTVHPSNGRDLAKQWTAAHGLKGAGETIGHDGYNRQTWTGRSVVAVRPQKAAI